TGEVHDTRTIVLAIGSGIIRPIQLEVDDVELYENSSLHYAVGDFSPFASKNILISGGGDSAVGWASELHSIAKTVTLVHRRDEFRAFEHSVHKMKKQVDVLTHNTVKTFNGDGALIKRVNLNNLES